MKNLFAFILVLLLKFSLILANIPTAPIEKIELQDYAHMLSSANNNLIYEKLNQFHIEKGFPIVLVTVESIEGSDIETYANELYNDWGIGNSQEKGVLLLIVKNDRELRIETGYGLEGDLPDALCGRIINNVIVPEFKGGNIENGILLGVKSIIEVFDPEFDFGGIKVSSSTDVRFTLPVSLPTVWDPQDLLSQTEIDEISSHLEELSLDKGWPYYFAIRDMENNEDISVMYDVFTTYRQYLGYDSPYVIVCISPKLSQYIGYDVNGLTFFEYLEHDDEQYPLHKQEMVKARKAAIKEISAANVSSGVNYYFSVLHEELKKAKKLSSKTTILILAVIFGIVFIIILFSRGSSSSSSNTRRSSYSGLYSSFSSSSSTSFGGGSSGGGGASGSW